MEIIGNNRLLRAIKLGAREETDAVAGALKRWLLDRSLRGRRANPKRRQDRPPQHDYG